MKFDFQTYKLGGRVLDERLRAPDRSEFTTLIPVHDGVLTAHHEGDFVGAWAMAMCMRDALLRVESVFPDYQYVDQISAGGESRKIVYDSPIAQLHWWQDRFDQIVEWEKQVVKQKRVSVAVDIEYAIVLCQAVDWFITRCRCRPPGLAEGVSSELDKRAENESGEGSLGVNISEKSGENLAPHERRSVDALRAFETSKLAFLDEFTVAGSARMMEEVVRPPADPLEREILGAINNGVFNRELEGDDQMMFGHLLIQRSQQSDGYREEDRKMLDRFRRYVEKAAPAVPPLKARWIQKDNIDLGRAIFQFGQLLFNSSLPNPEVARLREEELAAEKARKTREAEEKRNGTRGGGGGA